MMSLRKTLLFLFLILAYCGMAAAALRPSGRDVDSLIEYATGESKKGNFDEVAVVAGRLMELGRERDDRKASLYGLIYTGHALAREVSDSVKYYYGRALDLAAGLEDYRALAAINNALAIYTSEMEMNYLEGLSYFMKALKYAEQSSDKHSYPVILNNIAMAHYLRNDPNGLKYSLEVIDIGTANDDPLLLYSGSFVTAYMYYLLGDYAAALDHIGRALDVGGKYIEYAEAYSLYANILVRVGRESEAAAYYKRSLEHVGTEKSNTLAYLNYGSYLIGKGAAAEAAEVLEKGLDFVNKRNNAFYRYQLYEKLSEAYELADRPRTALKYYKNYHHEFDSIFNVERERAINELRVQYESEKQEKELREKELDLLREKQKLNVTIFVVVILAGLLAALFITYWRKNQRYRQIVRQQHELIRREQVIEKLYGQSDGSGIRTADENRQDIPGAGHNHRQGRRPARNQPLLPFAGDQRERRNVLFAVHQLPPHRRGPAHTLRNGQRHTDKGAGLRAGIRDARNLLVHLPKGDRHAADQIQGGDEEDVRQCAQGRLTPPAARIRHPETSIYVSTVESVCISRNRRLIL